MVLHIDVGRERSVFAIERALDNDGLIFLATQKDTGLEDPERDDIYDMGTLATVKSIKELENGTFRVLIEGVMRAEWRDYREADLFPVVDVTAFEEDKQINIETEALMRTLVKHFEKYVKASKRVSKDTFNSIKEIEEPGRLADMVASNLPIKLHAKQELLEIIDIKERLEWLINCMYSEQEVLVMESKINERVRQAMERTQKSFIYVSK